MSFSLLFVPAKMMSVSNHTDQAVEIAGSQQARITRGCLHRQSKKLMLCRNEIHQANEFLDFDLYQMPKPVPGISRTITPSAVNTAMK